MAKIWRGGSVMGREDRVGRRGRGPAASKDAADKDKKGPKVERLRALWPELRALVGPRRNLLLLGLVLIAINRVTGLVLPATTRYVIDDVIGKRRVDLLLPILGAVVGATVVQALTSFALTQTLSKAAQKLIADLRRRVQAHIGRLPVAFYDANKTGNLVSRIMSDVEGVRNLVGTGLVEFLGGILAAAVALVLMLRISPVMTGVTVFTSLTFAFVLFRAFATMRPIFRLAFAPIANAAEPVMRAVNALNPAGKTPLVEAVKQAADVLHDRTTRGVVVLLTDGEETCGGAPCALGQALKASGQQLTVHVIGFQLRGYSWTGAASILDVKCLAEQTGGLFITAQNREDLVQAFQKTLGCPMMSAVGALLR